MRKHPGGYSFVPCSCNRCNSVSPRIYSFEGANGSAHGGEEGNPHFLEGGRHPCSMLGETLDDVLATG